MCLCICQIRCGWEYGRTDIPDFICTMDVKDLTTQAVSESGCYEIDAGEELQPISPAASK